MGTMFFVLATALALTAGPASAPQDESKKVRKVCKTMGLTGTRLSRNKLCLTPPEWEKREQELKEQLGGEMRKGDIKNAGSSGG